MLQQRQLPHASPHLPQSVPVFHVGVHQLDEVRSEREEYQAELPGEPDTEQAAPLGTIGEEARAAGADHGPRELEASDAEPTVRCPRNHAFSSGPVPGFANAGHVDWRKPWRRAGGPRGDREAAWLHRL